jgi:Cu2+-exporting ATPase
MYIISGDHEAPTKRLAAELGIEHYFAETLPEKKASLIAKLQEEGKSVCYVGDGINDAIALKKAKVSISLRGAATIATDTAQVILMDKSLNQLGNLFDLAGEFKSNANLTFDLILYPNLAIVAGVFFFHLALVPSIVLAQLSFFSGLGNTMLPLHKHRKELAQNVGSLRYW